METSRSSASPFQRRLLLLLWSMGLVLILFVVQLFRLAVVQGAEMLAEAELALDQRRYLPAARGSIKDRRGRILACDRATYSVALPYEVITGAWARRQARYQAWREIGVNGWIEMTDLERHDAATARLDQWLERRDDFLDQFCALGEIDRAELDTRFDEITRRVQRIVDEVAAKSGERGTIREQTIGHVVLPTIPDDMVFDFRQLAREYDDPARDDEPLLEVRDDVVRDRPWSTVDVLIDRSTLPMPLRSDQPKRIVVEGVADHILGRTRSTVYETDLLRRPFSDTDRGGYRVENEVIGSFGLEKTHEDFLRGERGVVVEHLDSGDRSREAAQHGSDLELTIDLYLQARVQAILSPELGLTRVQPWHSPTPLPVGFELDSAAVVMEVETGEILAMVSMPTLAMAKKMSPIERENRASAVNRPVQAMYPPGSIVKPLVLSAAYMDGLHDLAIPIACEGHFFPDKKNVLRCWIYRDVHDFGSHGLLRGADALGKSCNIYFYTLADWLGMGRLTQWYREYGVGRPLDIGLGARQFDEEGDLVVSGEASGYVLPDARIANFDVQERRFATLALGIGQGQILWTPLHAANAFATLARRGRISDAKLLRNDPRDGERYKRMDLELDSIVLEEIYDGLRRTVELGGSASRLRYDDETTEPIMNAPGVRMWAKTGTAQAPKMHWDLDGNRKHVRDDELIGPLDHAWFVGLVGPESTGEKKYVIAVVVDFGGSGGRTAAPIANQIVHALQAEGYLPKPAPGEAAGDSS